MNCRGLFATFELIKYSDYIVLPNEIVASDADQAAAKLGYRAGIDIDLISVSGTPYKERDIYVDLLDETESGPCCAEGN